MTESSGKVRVLISLSETALESARKSVDPPIGIAEIHCGIITLLTSIAPGLQESNFESYGNDIIIVSGISMQTVETLAHVFHQPRMQGRMKLHAPESDIPLNESQPDPRVTPEFLKIHFGIPELADHSGGVK